MDILSALWCLFKFCMLILCLIGPGLALRALMRPRNAGFLQSAAWVTSLSIAFWSVLFSLLGVLHLSWMKTFISVGISSYLVSGLQLYHRRISLPSWRSLLKPLLVLLGLILIRFLPMLYCPVPPGADMSMHAALTRLIVAVDGVPSSLRPLLPVDLFGGYPTAFHALAAICAMTLEISPVAAAFGMGCATQVLVFLSVFLFAERRLSVGISLAVAWLICFASNNPQDYFIWGGNPTVLSLALCAVAARLLDDLLQEWSWTEAVLCAFLWAGAVNAHPIPVVCMLVVWPCWVLPGIWGNRRTAGQGLKDRLLQGLFMAAVAGFLLLPTIASPRPFLSEGELDWVRQWQASGGGAWHGSLQNSLWTIPHYAGRVLGWPLFLLAPLGFLWSAWRRKEETWKTLGCVAAVFAVVLNSRVWLLPLSGLLYPERVVVLLVFPLGVLVGGVLDELSSCRKWLVSGLMIWGGLQCVQRYLIPSDLKCAVTREDVAAMRWLASCTSPEDLIGNDYGDAGLWIPAVIGRPIATPHLHPAIIDETRDGLKDRLPSYVYLGAKMVYASSAYEIRKWLTADAFDPCYEKEGVLILQRVQP